MDETHTYYADRRAQHLMQIAIPFVCAVLVAVAWWTLGMTPRWARWVITGVLFAAAVAADIYLTPFFRAITYTVSETQITKRCGIIFHHEQIMRTSALQYVTMVTTPFSDKTGLNFIPLHAYGGTIYLSFLSRDDAREIHKFLRKAVYLSQK